jgi:phosphohistidine phosphatase SixA
VAAFLIRHAHAGSRSEWDQPDRVRPLSVKGVHQADHIASVLRDLAVGRIVSSPSRRCVQTVEPLASSLGLTIEEDAVLLEGSDPHDVVELLESIAPENPALCTHGDIIPEVIRLLSLRGMEITGPTGQKKGAVWVLQHDGARYVKAEYLPPG